MHTTAGSEDVPDSATTLRDSIFHEIHINDEGHIKNIDDEIDPLQDCPPLEKSSSSNSEQKDDHASNDGGSIHRKPSQAKEIWKFRLRPVDDDEPEDWWFASTGIPLLAATLGPMANVFSIAALVSPWRATYTDPGMVDDTAAGYADPHWCIILNAVSLAFGFGGNFFLLCNFTQAVRYIVALPVTIILWFFATGILTSITICMNLYAAPIPASSTYIGDTYTEGFWYAVIASVLYFVCSALLMINMLGYALGHYAQHFELDDDQRNLILQTMMFFLWLAGGGGVFARVNDWSYADSLYFCDVTILTVGFGDFYSHNDLGRGLVFPFSVGGIIILGLVVSSISRFATQLGHDKVIKKKLERRRVKTLSMTVTTSTEKAEREASAQLTKNWNRKGRPEISAPFDPRQRSIAFDVRTPDVRSVKSPRTVRSAYAHHLDAPVSPKTPQSWVSGLSDKVGSNRLKRTLTRSTTMSFTGHPALKRMTTRSTKLKMLRDERDRFNEMRNLQDQTRTWKKYVSLIMSVTAFSILWCGGALVFHLLEGDTYFQALYFCYVSLLTIGYGDLAPTSNPGKPFFVLWSLCAIPTMTILISNMGDTIIASYKRGTFKLGDWTLLPKKGFIKTLLERHPRLQAIVRDFIDQHHQKERLEQGFPVGPEDTEEKQEENNDALLEELASEEALDEHDLAQKLVDAIRETANHLKSGWRSRYSYEEWVEYTRLIRFTQYSGRRESTAQWLDEEERDEGIIEWDWIGEDSPMMADVSETEWVLDRLTESLDRYMRHQIPELKKRQDDSSPRRKSIRTSMESRSRSIDKQIEETGFTPINLLAPEGPRRRANSGQRRSPSPSRIHAAPWRSRSAGPFTPLAERDKETPTDLSFRHRQSTISTQPDNDNDDDDDDGQDLQSPDPTQIPLPPVRDIDPLDPRVRRPRPSLQHLSTESSQGSSQNPTRSGSASAQGASGSGPTPRRNTVAPKKAASKQAPKRRMGSGEGMQSLTAMRLRRQQ